MCERDVLMRQIYVVSLLPHHRLLYVKAETDHGPSAARPSLPYVPSYQGLINTELAKVEELPHVRAHVPIIASISIHIYKHISYISIIYMNVFQ